jgi:predicted dehydrogenase
MNETTSNEKKSKSKVSRRTFVTRAAVIAAGATAVTAAGITIIPRHVMGGGGYKAASDTPNIAGIGFGNQGGADIQNIATMDVPTKQAPLNLIREPYAGLTKPRGAGGMAGGFNPSVVQMGDAGQGEFHHANIYALCDVDHEYGAYMFAGYPNAKKYTDFRKLIDNEKSLDGVLIATPDHTHAVIAAYAMAAGLHVFVEKPMAKTIYETRKLAALAKKYKVITQMGNQGHNVAGTWITAEWIQSGKIGQVKEVHMWSDRPVWPQGYLKRPEGVPVPEHIDYDLWLGPAPQKPYHPDILHFNWRGLQDYGTGALGDMGAHTFDAPIVALGLGLPTHVQATSTPVSEDYLPKSQRVTFIFPKTKDSLELIVTWQDGGIKPPRPKALEANRQLMNTLYIGDKGMIMHGTHGANPALIPDEPEFAVEPWMERPKSVYVDWIDAIKEGRKAKNDFEISSVLTEILLLSNVAVLSQQVDITLEYDSKNMKFKNLPEADQYIHYEYRKGWEKYLEV